MAKNSSQQDDSTLIEVKKHYTTWTEDSDKRLIRKNGWNDITDAWFGKLPDDWPYQSKVVDPCLRTSIIEKNGRLLNAKLRGRLVPREGGDVLKSRINNAILDYQWDTANDGGTMLDKWGGMDEDTRLYASRFGLVKWRYVEKDGKCTFNGNEFKPLDIRDSGLDPQSTGIRDAKWFQHREWMKVEDMETTNDLPSGGKLFPGLSKLKEVMSNGSDRRDTAYTNRPLQLKGLEDRMGQDKAYPVVEVVTEYRTDRWITFAPKHNVILRDIPNPYKHGRIPVVQLRYYKLTGDPMGESEAEPVLPLWRAIQATLCGFLDSMNIHMRPPLKIIDGQVRIETIVFGPEAQMLMDRPDSVTEFQSSGDPLQYFQTSFSSLKSAFNTAMGDLSQGVSNVDPLNPKKTATEVNNSVRQQNSRDQKNQTSLAEAIEDMMGMWLVNNRQFLFADPEMKEYIVRIVGSDLFNYFQKAGLDEEELSPEATQMIGDIVHQNGGNLSDDDLQAMVDAGKTPKFPVFENVNEKNPAKLKFKPKMRLNDTGDGAELSVVPEDLDGMYDYVADVRSMSSGADKDLQQGRQAAIDTLTTNPQVLQLLQLEGVKPQVKDLLISQFEGLGLTDAERYFGQIEPQPTAPGGPGQGAGPLSASPNGGVPANPAAGPQGPIQSAPSQPQGLPQQGGLQ